MPDLKTRILHIEDNPGDARLVKEMLADAEPASYELVQVARLDQALAKLASEQIDVVLADLGLPDSQGLDTLKQLRGAFPELPVIVMSGMSDENVAVQAVQEGAQDYIVKGHIDVYGCTRAIRYAIERKREAEALRQSEEKYRLLVENVTVGIVVAQDGVVKYSNRKAQEISGYTYEELSTFPFAELIHPADLEQTVEYYLAFLRGEETPANHMFRSIAKGGQIKWLESNAVLIAWEGRPATLNFLTIVTERKQREFELEAIAAMGAALRVAESRTEMLGVILDQLFDVLHAKGAVLALLDPVSGEIVIEMGRGAWAGSTGVRLAPGTSVSERVIATGERYVTTDLAREPQIVRRDLVGELNFAACVPLTVRGQTIGALGVGRQSAIEEAEVRLLTSIADLAANAIHRETLHERAEQQVQQLTALATIDRAITASLKLDITLGVLLDQTVAQLRVDAADILLFVPDTQTLEFAAGRGLKTSYFRSARVKLGEGCAGLAALERKTILIKDWQSEIPDSAAAATLAAGLKAEGFVSLVVVPLVAKGQVTGVLEIFHRTPLAPDRMWLDFLQALAEQAAIAVDNAHLFENVQRTNVALLQSYDATIEGWSRALDLRDKETEGHTQRVVVMTLALARAMQVEESELVHIRRGALLHDIGKMGVPDTILRKPGPLTESEWEIMRRHPEYAYELLSPIDYLRPAIDIPYGHHEKWDGAGYPLGIKGRDIPLEARIFAVVDVWDALRSDRPYRPAWGEETTREYIRAQAGQHFDPKVVELFLELIENK